MRANGGEQYAGLITLHPLCRRSARNFPTVEQIKEYPRLSSETLRGNLANSRFFASKFQLGTPRLQGAAIPVTRTSGGNNVGTSV